MASYRRLAAAAAVPAAAPASTAALAAFRPGIAVVVCALAVTFSLTFVLLLYAKHCKRSSGNGGRGYSSSAGAAPGRHSGTARAVVESLPAFRFGALEGPHKDGLECAVCLARFETAEVLRLLPKCRHAFHLECVDVWLDAHSTCPLCRSRVDPEDVLLLLPEPNPPRSSKVDAGDPPPPGRRISGRHSSAGEISAAAHRANSMWRRSADSAARAASVGCFERARKDGLLLAEGEEAVAAAVDQRFGHRIVVSAAGGAQERWSDLRPADLLVLRPEMIIGDGGRCASEITRYPRRCGGGAGRREAEEVERRWRLGWGRSGNESSG